LTVNYTENTIKRAIKQKKYYYEDKLNRRWVGINNF
jgi:hypothetical protein